MIFLFFQFSPSLFLYVRNFRLLFKRNVVYVRVNIEKVWSSKFFLPIECIRKTHLKVIDDKLVFQQSNQYTYHNFPITLKYHPDPTSFKKTLGKLSCLLLPKCFIYHPFNWMPIHIQSVHTKPFKTAHSFFLHSFFFLYDSTFFYSK